MFPIAEEDIMKIGSTIEELILTNIKIWHEVTKVKDISGKLHTGTKMSLEDRVECALEIRELNAQRSKARWNVDQYFDGGNNETKIFSEE